MTNEQLDEIEAQINEFGEESGFILPLVKALREARAEAEKWRLKYDCLKGDADVAVIEMNAAIEFADKAKAEVERLRDALQKVHALAEKGTRDWPGHTAFYALTDIHKITKGMVE